MAIPVLRLNRIFADNKYARHGDELMGLKSPAGNPVLSENLKHELLAEGKGVTVLTSDNFVQARHYLLQILRRDSCDQVTDTLC